MSVDYMMFLISAFLRVVLLLCLCRTSFAENGPSHNRVVVKEGSDVVLRCSSGNQDLTSALFDWRKEVPNGRQEVFFYDAGIHYNNGRGGQDPQFKGRVSHFGGELQHGNASIKIHNTKMEDSGDYTCYFPRLDQTFYVQLVVDGILKDRSGSPGVAPAPDVTILKATNDWWRLQCDVQGASTKPKVEWQNSDGKVLHSQEPEVTESEGRYNVTLLITVNQTGRYHCVVTQEELHHQTDDDTYVHICGSENPGKLLLISGFVGLVLGVLGTVAVQRIWPVVRKHNDEHSKHDDEKLWTCRTCTCRSASLSSETPLEREEACRHELMSEKLPPS